MLMFDFRLVFNCQKSAPRNKLAYITYLINNMIYTTQERNDAILLIADGKADLNNILLYERLQEFQWIIISKLNGIINKVELTYFGKELSKRLLKQQGK